MKRKVHISLSRLVLFSTIILAGKSYAQIGINTSTPQASLHIEASNPDAPTATDGILIPRLNALPTTGTNVGQLLFLQTSSNNSGFYIWTGESWELLAKESIDRKIDESIYTVVGNSTNTTYSTSYNSQNLLFTTLTANDTTGFSVSNNTVTIGKTGTYLVNISSSLKTEATTGQRATFEYKLRKTTTNAANQQVTTDEAKATSSIPNEKITATNISFSNIISLKKGDKLYVSRQKMADNNNSANIGFITYGNNTLRLTFLQ